MAAKTIIVLETNTNDGGQVTLRTAMWFPITPGKEVPRPDILKSQWSGASGPEVASLQSGSVLEEVRVMSFPKSFTTAQIKASLVAAYSDRLAYLASLPFVGQYYGLFYDGSVWSA